MRTQTPHPTVAVFAVLFLAAAAGLAQPGAANAPGPAAPRSEWPIPAGLQVDGRASIDVSADRKLAAVWGTTGEEANAHRSCWVINLQTGQAEDALAKVAKDDADALRGKGQVKLSPDGKRLGVWSASAMVLGIIDLSTGSAVLVSRPHVVRPFWAGDRLLLAGGKNGVEAVDANGRSLGMLSFVGDLAACDETGRRLLGWSGAGGPMAKGSERELTTAVTDADGNAVRKIGMNQRTCPWGPWFSRYGGCIAVYYNDPNDKWVTRVFSTTSDEVITLKPHEYGGLIAVADTGEGIRRRPRGNSTGLEFWAKDGNCRTLAEAVVSATIMGGEVFFVQRDSAGALVLKAVPFPKDNTPPTLPTTRPGRFSDPGRVSDPVRKDPE